MEEREKYNPISVYDTHLEVLNDGHYKNEYKAEISALIIIRTFYTISLF